MSLAQKLQGKLTQSSQSETSSQTPEKVLKDFIAEDPNSTYTFTSERDAPQSELCRDGKEKGKKCIMMQMHSTRLFQAMQDQGFFCALPMDPKGTHIECKPLPKT
ncbi:hypothetical protein L226DRAFT_566492 [Lentinus tigrinus ALCF2SS1-7]|uniref:Uncharacterized protein n=1 Tax=Lentinus tigrinus ALCF2SS1-6 TaxID=1328759 RepID=A0A5C2SQS6_9APHY|nr:hypothetical protein L227DRAFT_648806 [Lentinus tigrinus ALCF2SS1-6]RPD79948.1 hypothetical protein L226DRAFT_566492 [Lentinus tigrinus ALCF2SS1-7]